MEDKINNSLLFLKEIEKFKTIKRKIFLSTGRAESDAEHSWHLAMFVILFKNELPKNADFEKMLKLALIHDLPEIYAGDTFAFDKLGQTTKKVRESKAAKKLFSILPKKTEKEFSDLIKEYEENKTKEAQIVKAIDKIQPILQNLCSNGKSWKKYSLTYEDIDDYKRKYVSKNKFLFKIYNQLLDEAKSRKMI